jgi:hypothetical protein
MHVCRAETGFSMWWSCIIKAQSYPAEADFRAIASFWVLGWKNILWGQNTSLNTFFKI